MSRTNSSRRFWSLLVVSAIVVGCAGASPSPAPDLGSTAPFTAQVVSNAVTALAGGGISVRVRPADSPLVAVQSASRVALMRFQARNLALEAHVGAGTYGRELDEYAAEAGSQPLAPLIAGWLQTADTEASRQARIVAPTLNASDPAAMVVPGLVAMLFLADVVGPAPAGAHPVARGLAAAGGFVAADDDFCGQVSAYLASVLGGILDPELTLNPPWLETAARSFGAINTDPDEMRAAVGALALLAYATSVSRPWVAKLTAVPGEVHYIVGDDELTAPSKEFSLIVNVGEGAIAEEAVECADLAGVDLSGSDEADAIPVAWYTPELQPHAVDIEGDLELEERGEWATAVLEYETRAESEDAHRNGTPQTAVATVAAIVERTEIRDLESAVKRLLTGTELGATAGTVAAHYESLRTAIQNRLYPRASAKVTVTWHAGPEETPRPSPRPEPCESGCAMSNGDPHIVTVDGNAYDFQAAGEFVLLRSADGSVEIQGRQVPLPELAGQSVTINSALAMRVDGRRVGIHVQEGTNVLSALVDGVAADPGQTTAVGSGHLRPIESGLAWEIAFPDGSFAYAIGLGGTYGINILLEPAQTLATDGRGVMGPFPEGSWAPALPDGAPLAPQPPDLRGYWQELYVRFAEAWRVTQKSSLFDYDAGQATATFAIPAFPPPENLVRLEDLTAEQRAAGEAACGLVTDPIVHAQCVFDVGVTSDSGWAEGYEATLTLVETGALPSTGAQARVVNLYSENGQPVEVDVYAYTWSQSEMNEVAALVATVPYGQASDWFNPGLVQSPFGDEPFTKVQIFRRGEQVSPLGGVGEFLGPGTVTTIAIWREEVFEGEPGAWLQTIYAEHPTYPVPEAPVGQGLLVSRDGGLRADDDRPVIFASVGDGCLESPFGRSDPDIPSAQPVGNDLVLPVGEHTLAVHDEPVGELPSCETKPLGPGAPIAVAPGDRYLAFPYQLPGATEVNLLVVPFGTR